jgi:homoserine kinase
MSAELLVSAPASTANLGPGFDSAAAALDLWNELRVLPAAAGAPVVEIEGEGAGELPRDQGHLALRAFAVLAPLEGLRFAFRNRIPLERGLGSSAAAIAAGLVAACAVSGRELTPDQLLELGAPLEGHADNLAAALRGGACLAWRAGEARRSVRVATALPLDPIVVVPEARVATTASRERMPEFLRHAEAVEAASAAALLGAALASGDAELLAAAFHDRLHEPYRLADAPVLAALRAAPPAGSAGSTLSGSGPSVVVWARPELAAAVAAELEGRFPDARVLRLVAAPRGAHAVGSGPGERLRASGAETGARA